MRASLLAALMIAPAISAQPTPPHGRAPAPENAGAPEQPSERLSGPAAPTAAASSDRPAAAPEASALRHASSPPQAARSAHAEPIQMVGVLREFVDGHPDLRPGRAPGRHLGIVADRLDGEGKPVFISRGYRVLRPARDAAGEPIMGPRRYIEPRRGDLAPQIEPVEGEAVQSAWSVGSLFRHSAASRASVHRVALRPALAPPGEDAAHIAELDGPDAPHRARADGPPRATARTLELTGRFTHRAGAGHRLRFSSADHLWVFIDGWLVVDLGGSYEPAAAGAPDADCAQTVDLDRLAWLRDGEEYDIKIFCASRGGSRPPRVEAMWSGRRSEPAVAAEDESVQD